MGLRKFAITRLIQAVFTIWVIATLLFLLFRLLPGDPASTVVSPALSSEVRARLLAAYGLDEPLYVQYGLYMKNLVTFDWGVSYLSGRPVVDVLSRRLVNTLVLMLPVMFVSIILGVVVGTLSAWRRDSKADTLSLLVGFFCRSFPIFFSGMIALLIFSFHFGFFPAGRMLPTDYAPEGFVETYLNLKIIRHLALPFIAGVFYYWAPPFLLMRSTMLEIMGEPFLDVLKAKGVKERAIMFKHAARNSLLPVVTVSTLLIGYAVGGQVLLETVFSWPGMGQAIVTAVRQHDYPIAQFALLMMASLVVILNLVADLVYTRLDPRVEYE